MSELKLYRKRFIPQETIWLKDDIIVSKTKDYLATSWKTLKPKTAFSHGCSCYFFKEGFKLSKFYQQDGSLLYYYCDIMEFSEDTENNILTTTDLLADVIIYPDGTFKIMDLDELADAYEQKLISTEQLTRSLRQLNHLLSIIQKNEFQSFLHILESLGL